MDLTEIIEGRRDYELARLGEQEARLEFHAKLRAARRRGATWPALSKASGYDWEEVKEICHGMADRRTTRRRASA